MLLFFSVACILSLRANTFKRGRATKPSTSCPELGRNWMKHEDALFSFSTTLFEITIQDSCYLETLHTLNILFSIYDVHNNYGGKSFTTYWFLVSLCYWGYWTVAELFVLDIYLYLNYYNLNQYMNMNNYIDICLY